MNKRRNSAIDGRKAAVALRYKRGSDHAPRLVAKGVGLLAEKILDAAEEAGIPIYQDPDLLALLMTLNIDELIPPEMYIAVAEILAFIYRLDKKALQG